MPSKTSSTSSPSRKSEVVREWSWTLPAPSLFATACHWSDPWLIGAATRTGTRHYGAGLPSDDAMLVTACGPHVLLAVADGAGDPRATRSREAAMRAVAVASAEAARSYPVIGLDVQLLTEALAAAHVDLVGRAGNENVDPAVFATTLGLVLLAGNRVLAARVGDGSAYTWDGKRLTRFCPTPLPSSGTTMIVQPDWRRWMATADEEREFVVGLALGTDGVDDFFLDDGRQTRSPTPERFEQLAAFSNQFGPTAAMAFVMQALNDPQLAARTDDDRTLIMAIKPQSAVARPPCAAPLRPHA